ncbi:uncharacterized protein [Physcomitrium patens]|uniref:BSD domain-containing protein n=2 Tax=Physcomitrium patens TaxID=3218 RepID=A0A2K1JQV0_PHYPA|nr:uncharacterized protein LOC112289944 isoform X1 [Physcomitrium patens]PNR43913.1 hypothetical protein PHYPA_016296 [Physcomitrium patens]|eukprot:XP_024391475.1 uncharacterized protein LOC112289944 isoform X1 [Physcomitrella patens]
MDFFFQKARYFAQETAKKSQEIAMEAAKLSQDLAQETAKRSRELSHDLVVEASKKADQIKTLATELSPTIVGRAIPSGVSTPTAAPTEEELKDYGITPELREFVKGLTIRTFRDFPLEESSWKMTATESTSQVRQDLSEWQERHAVLVLLTVPEISDFRYVLCPRRMRESKFWKIYFILVQNYVAPFEAMAAERAAAKAEAKSESDALKKTAAPEEASGSSSRVSVRANPPGAEAETTAAANSLKSVDDDADLDAYLMGALGSDDEAGEGVDDDFDKDFDKLVNSAALDSDGEEAAREGARGSKPKNSDPTSGLSKSAASEGSSDGELVEIPDQESDAVHKKKIDAAE